MSKNTFGGLRNNIVAAAIHVNKVVPAEAFGQRRTSMLVQGGHKCKKLSEVKVATLFIHYISMEWPEWYLCKTLKFRRDNIFF